MLAEISFQGNREAEYEEKYEKILKSARTQSISLGGEIIAESEWRVGLKILNLDVKHNDADRARRALLTHISKAINYYVDNYDPEGLFSKLRRVWPLLRRHNINPPTFRPNPHVLRLVLS